MINKKCLVCGYSPNFLFKNNDKLLDKSKRFDLLKCEKCSLISLYPIPSKEKISSFYPDEYEPYNKKNNFFYSRIKNFILNLKAKKIKKLVSKNSSVLEIGCGEGSLLKRLKDIGNFDVYGVEFNGYVASKARKKRLKVFLGTLEEANFSEEKFDLIIMEHVIEHLSNPEITLKEINRILKKGGKFLFTTPNSNSLDYALFKKYWYGLDTPRHIFVFSDKNIVILLKKFNFKNINLKYSLIPNNFIGSLRYVIRAKLSRRLSYSFKIESLLFLILFFPISFLAFLFKKSGRIEIITEK